MNLLLQIVYGIVGLLSRSSMYNDTVAPAVTTPATVAVSSRSKVAAIQEVMADGLWRTVKAIREVTPELAGLTDEQIKSRIRDIRNRPGYAVKSQKIQGGVFEYQVSQIPVRTLIETSTEERPVFGGYNNLDGGSSTL